MSRTLVATALEAARRTIDAIDARALLCHVTRRSAAYLIAHADAALTDIEDAQYTSVVERRAAGEPVAYLVGEREFYGRPFLVTPAVLIPRPETELLVEHAVRALSDDAVRRVLDLGTGSGCVALSIASECLHCKITGTDQSVAALDVAQRNVERLGLANVELVRSDWFANLGSARFELIVSNPPYVATGDPHLTRGDLTFEPESALIGGRDGLDCIREIVAGATRHLVDGGSLLVEHGHDQAARVRAMMEQRGYREVFSARDLAGIERVTGGRLTLRERADTIPDKLTQV